MALHGKLVGAPPEPEWVSQKMRLPETASQARPRMLKPLVEPAGRMSKVASPGFKALIVLGALTRTSSPVIGLSPMDWPGRMLPSPLPPNVVKGFRVKVVAALTLGSIEKVRVNREMRR